MLCTAPKAEMDLYLSNALTAAGISKQQTRIGREILCRCGDPTSVADLTRVSADTATCVCIMMTREDEQANEESGGKIQNGATLRTLLALRHVLLTSANDSPIRNIVVQLARPSLHIDAARSPRDRHDKGAIMCVSFRKRRVHLGFVSNNLSPIDLGAPIISREFQKATRRGFSVEAFQHKTLEIAYTFERESLVYTLSLHLSLSLSKPRYRLANERVLGSSRIRIQACFRDQDNRRLVFPLDLSLFLNSLMFSCTATPNLSTVLMDLLDARGSSFRRRRAPLFCGGVVGQTLESCGTRLRYGVVIGVVPTAGGEAAAGSSSGKGRVGNVGLCADPSHVVAETDLIIFIAETASPTWWKDGAARDDGAKAAQLQSTLQHTGLTTPLCERHVLVCGWRPVWTDVPERLATRVTQMCHDMSSRSRVTFLNGVPKDLFADLMDTCGFARAKDADSTLFGQAWRTQGRVLLSHVNGDAADVNLLRPLISGHAYTTAVVMGTNARACRTPRVSCLEETCVRVLSRHTQVL